MPDFGYTPDQWEYLSRFAQWLTTAHLCALGRGDHTAEREARLRTIVRACEIMLKVKGQEVPDYYVYRKSWIQRS